MKRILLIANIVLAAAVVVLYVLFFTTGKKTTTFPHAGESNASELPAGSIVYIQIDSLINGLDLYHALRVDWEAKAKVIDDDLTKKGRALERDVADFTDKYQKGLLTRSQAETQGTQLEARQRELQQYSQQKQIEMAEEEQVLLNNVVNEIQTFIAAYNQEHNFSLILSTSGAPGSILNSNPSIDITKDVLAGLNAQYAAQHSRRR
jgi:outer membrane protein